MKWQTIPHEYAPQHRHPAHILIPTDNTQQDWTTLQYIYNTIIGHHRHWTNT